MGGEIHAAPAWRGQPLPILDNDAIERVRGPGLALVLRNRDRGTPEPQVGEIDCAIIQVDRDTRVATTWKQTAGPGGGFRPCGTAIHRAEKKTRGSRQIR